MNHARLTNLLGRVMIIALLAALWFVLSVTIGFMAMEDQDRSGKEPELGWRFELLTFVVFLPSSLPDLVGGKPTDFGGPSPLSLLFPCKLVLNCLAWGYVLDRIGRWLGRKRSASETKNSRRC